MEEKISKAQYLAITAILCLVVAFNFLRWQSLIIGISFGLAYLIFYSFIFGSIFIAKRGWQTIFGLLFLLSLIAIFGAATIYFYQFNNYLFILLLLLIPALLIIPYYYSEIKKKFYLKQTIKDYLAKFNERQEPKTNSSLVIIYLILAATAFFLLAIGQTTKSIQAPWQIVSNHFFIIYFLATATLLIYLFNSVRTKLPLLLITIHSFLSVSVALIVYKIGYGFDPFIHQATENIIAQTGTITPTPLYYLGQYAVVVFLSKLTLINLEIIDRTLVPILFSIFLPLTIFYVFSQWLKKNYALILSLTVLVIPFSSFIMTAPQNLANLFFIITILLSMLYYRNQIKVSVLYLLTLATLAIHPLAGIPLLVTVILINMFKVLYNTYKQYLSLYFLASLVFILFLPLAFIANGSTINLSPILQISDFKIFGWVDKFDLPLNLVYLVYINKLILAGLITIIGLIYLAKNKLLKNNAGYLMAALVILADFIIVKYFLVFPDLREFDKNPFVGRLAMLSFYILLPFFLLGLYWIIKKMWSKDLIAKGFLVFVLAGAITISFYLSYPRVNQYEPAKFFSLSASDVTAVNFIEEIAAPDHIVLANQMVGVAAIKEFGFKKYYNGQFYYSMPMGTPRTFYDYYLEMVYEGAKKETMERAMVEADVSEAYFVLNKYWRNFEKIARQASASTDAVYVIDDDEIYIFKYSRN